jgi:2-keto-4-pentenoate hydratase/2-oxohepta-3-ene-1,7-dioic acid hydratase in catechol pathway
VKIARWDHAGEVGEGFVIDGAVVRFPDAHTVESVLSRGLDRAHELFGRVHGGGVPLSAVTLLAPLVPASVRDFATYEEHLEGMTADAAGQGHVSDAWYEAPRFRFSNRHMIFGTGATIRPPATERLDYELGVAAVLGGEPGIDLSPEEAATRIFGYVITNDWSARDIQFAEMQARLGPVKGKDFATSIGPWIVTADEVATRMTPDGFLALRAEAYVDRDLTGSDLVSNMAWTFPELIAYAARASRVMPGDVVCAGAMGNGGSLGELWGRAGGALTPRPLQPGDEVVFRVELLGELAGTVGEPFPARSLPAARRRPKPRARAL